MWKKIAVILVASQISTLAFADFEFAFQPSSCANLPAAATEGSQAGQFCFGTMHGAKAVMIKTTSGNAYLAKIKSEEVLSDISHSHSGTPPIQIRSTESTLTLETASGLPLTLDQFTESSNGQTETHVTGTAPDGTSIDARDFSAN